MTQRELTSDFRALLAGKVEVTRRIDELAAEYRNAKPFPHLIMDGMFSDSTLVPLLSEIADMSGEQWVNVDRDPRERTVRMRSAAEMRDAGERMLSIVHSAGFLYFLSEITGVGQLLPDPYLQGGGFAVMRRGDYFDVHADTNVAECGLTRRLAMIVFLNKSWLPEYNGQLELCSEDGKRCEVSVEPLFNRTILFEVAYPNYHGVPAPLKCPSSQSRQSFIVYYHTAGLQKVEDKEPHNTVFAPRFYGTPRATVRTLVREVLPPFVLRVARKIFK